MIDTEKLFANIIIDISHEKVDRPFQYRVPQHLLDEIKVGMRVEVPFGKGNTLRTGYVIEITHQAEYPVEKIKEIAHILIDGESQEGRLIQLARWMKEQYGSTMITALKTVLPIKKVVKQKEEKSVQLLITRKEAIEQLESFRRKSQKGKVRLLEQLIENPFLDYKVITGELHISSSTIQSLQKSSIIEVVTKQCYRNPIQVKQDMDVPKHLSINQQKIVDTVVDDLRKQLQKTYLLHGITGSGKTEVYLNIIDSVILMGKQVIVLIPEIALTYQTTMRFYKRFGDRVSIMNSSLSQGEKYDQFERAKKQEIDVIIGPRSAMFTPFPNLGLIVIDEEHEGSYKSESMPKYHARDVAIQYANMCGASVLLGSATPSLESYYQATHGDITLFRLEERLTGGTLPQVYITDLREELKRGNRSIFGQQLQEMIRQRLQKREQIMLFLNRRGYAGFVSCRSCGHVMKCPHCDISLSEHKRHDNGKLVCHYCGYEEEVVSSCPKCGSKYISGFRAGTQQIEEHVKSMFPSARVLRMDGDTTKTKESYGTILQAFSRGEADILIGTQMIVKGHDFHNVTLVGIIAADLSLASNDYRASERTFQLITQAAGRAGRGEKPGEVVIQTYQPDHYSIVHAANQDYESFYEEEMVYRELMNYPPAAHILTVQIMSKDEDEGMELANKLSLGLKQRENRIQEQLRIEGKKEERIQVIGPVVARVSKISDIYRFGIYMKHKDKDKLIEKKDLIENYLKSYPKRDILIQFDFDPMNPY